MVGQRRFGIMVRFFAVALRAVHDGRLLLVTQLVRRLTGMGLSASLVFVEISISVRLARLDGVVQSVSPLMVRPTSVGQITGLTYTGLFGIVQVARAR